MEELSAINFIHTSLLLANMNETVIFTFSYPAPRVTAQDPTGRIKKTVFDRNCAFGFDAEHNPIDGCYDEMPLCHQGLSPQTLHNAVPGPTMRASRSPCSAVGIDIQFFSQPQLNLVVQSIHTFMP